MFNVYYIKKINLEKLNIMSKDTDKNKTDINPFVKEAAINTAEVIAGRVLNLSTPAQIGIAIGTAGYHHPKETKDAINIWGNAIFD